MLALTQCLVWCHEQNQSRRVKCDLREFPDCKIQSKPPPLQWQLSCLPPSLLRPDPFCFKGSWKPSLSSPFFPPQATDCGYIFVLCSAISKNFFCVHVVLYFTGSLYNPEWPHISLCLGLPSAGIAVLCYVLDFQESCLMTKLAVKFNGPYGN